MNIYYKLWVDAIVFEKTKHKIFGDFIFITLMGVSFIQSLNLLTIYLWLIMLGVNINLLGLFTFIPVSGLAKFLNYFIVFMAPFIIINYIFIFHNQKYKKLIKRYKYRNGKLYKSYYLVSFGIFILPIIIHMLV